MNDPQLFFFFFVIVVHESLVCPEQLNCLLFFRKILQVPQILWFSSIFMYLNPFQQWLYDFQIHLFTLRITEGLICNYYRRFKRSLMSFEQNEEVYIFLILPKYNIFSFSTALQKLQKILTCFPRVCMFTVHMSASVVLSVKRWISKSYSHCWKGFKKKIQNQKICGTWRIFLKNSKQFNCLGQTSYSGQY